MDERCAYGFLISIDTSDRIGATSVYGEHEIITIIKEGAKTCGYEAEVSWVDDNTPSNKRQYNVIVHLK